MTVKPVLPVPDRYNATLLSHHDGDTFDVEVAWGRRRFDRPIPIRLLGCNAWELATPAGKAAAANLQALLPPGTPLLLTACDDDKYAPRWDCTVSYVGADGNLRDLVTDLVADGWAAAWNGRGPAPLPAWPRLPAAGSTRAARFVSVRRAVAEWQSPA